MLDSIAPKRPGMHELTLCRALVEQVVRVARDHRARRIVSVTVRIGELSGVEPQLLESAYPLSSEGTLAAGSRLLLERSPLRVRCLDCGAEFDSRGARLRCPACGKHRVQVLSGEELLLASVELEKDDG